MSKIDGLGLLEILIALTVISLGIAMHSALFTQFQLHHASTRNQRLAWRLAEQKFDDLKDFRQLQSTADFDFNDIQNNSGGKQIKGSLLLPAGPVEQRWTGSLSPQFNLSWQVENGYWQNSQLIYQDPTKQPPYPDQKRISIQVSWFEADEIKQINVQGIVAALSPLSEILLYRPQATGVTHKPILQQQTDSASTDIPIALNDLSKLITEVKSLDQEKATQIRAVTVDHQGHVLKQSDFLTVSCQCQFSADGYQKTSAHGHWDTVEQTLFPQSGDTVLKAQGCALDEVSGQCSTQTNTLCERCCRDHHDPKLNIVDSAGQAYCDPVHGIRDRCYDPFRNQQDYTNGQHPHYNSQGQIVSSGNYIESCRFRNINGKLEVYQDWYRLDLILVPWQWLQNNLTPYQDWLKASLTTVIRNSDSFWGQIRPDDTDSSIQWPDKHQILDTLIQPWPLKLGDFLLLSARGLYVDYMDNTTVLGLKQLLSKNKNAISQIPFYELAVNTFAPYCLINQSGWCSSASDVIEVGAGLENSPNGLSPGLLSVKQYSDQQESISFSLKRNNSGLIPFASASDFSGLVNNDSAIDKAEFSVQILGP
jgi:hypothetical protein